MKKISLFFLTCCLMASCGNSDGDDVDVNDNLLELSASECTLSNTNTYAIIDIVKSDGECVAVSSDENIAKTFIHNNKIHIMGFNTGNTSVVVTDENNNKATIKVNTQESIARPVYTMQTFIIKKGDSRTIQYDSPQNYQFSLEGSEDIVSIGDAADGMLNIKGENLGNVTLYILKDFWPVQGYLLKVLDYYPVMLSETWTEPEHMPITVGTDFFFHVFLGNGNYQVRTEPHEPEMLMVEVGAFTGVPDQFYYHPATIRCKALHPGEVTITVIDEIGQNESFKIDIR